MKKQRHSGNHGYALVLCMVLVMLAGMSALTVSRLSIRRAQMALDTERDLQIAVAFDSCEKTGEKIGAPLLQEVLRHAQLNSGDRLPVVSCEITLCGRPFKLIFSDEQGKLNLNALIRQQGLQQTGSRLRDLLIHLPLASRTALLSDKITTWADVFKDADPADYIRASIPQRAIEGSATLWGNGRVNVLSATDRTLRVALNGAMDDLKIDRLLAARKLADKGNLASWLEVCELSDTESAHALAVLTDKSKIRSLWIAATIPGRPSYRLIVLGDEGDQTEERRIVFEW